MNYDHRRRFPSALALLVLLPSWLLTRMALAMPASGMPWDPPLNRTIDLLTGTLARVIVVLACVGLTALLVVSEPGTMRRKALWAIVVIITMALAAQWGIGYIGVGSGLVV